jgi:hypothetical protein
MRAGQVTVLDPVLSCSTTAVGHQEAEPLLLHWYPSPWTERSTLRWDLGKHWQPGARAELIDARGQLVWQGLLPSPAGELAVEAETRPGLHLLQVRSGTWHRYLKGLAVRAP